MDEERKYAQWHELFSVGLFLLTNAYHLLPIFTYFYCSKKVVYYYFLSSIRFLKMDFPDLNFIRSDIDPATVKPLDTRDLVRIINDFLLTSSDFLNSFCAKFEDRILTLEARLNSFESQLILLEQKLADIPDSVGTIQQNMVGFGCQQMEGCSIEKNESANKDELGPPTERLSEEEQQPKMSASSDREEKPPQSQEGDANGMAAKDHPIMGKYFRMLKMGVPEPAVKQKMRSEGVDPAILDQPERQMPIGAKQKQEAENSGAETMDDMDGSFSSSSNNSSESY